MFIMFAISQMAVVRSSQLGLRILMSWKMFAENAAIVRVLYR